MGIGVLKPVRGYENFYSVSDKGEVFSHISNKWLKPNLMNNGYKSVELFHNGKSKRILIHRLVAEAFINNPQGFPHVNHKDEDKGNNCVENLEWCTAKYNQNYGTCQERKRESLREGYWKTAKSHADHLIIGQRTKELLGKRVIQRTKDGEIVAEFISVNEAMRQTNIRHIHEACTGKRKTAGGYTWEFREERK